MVLRYRVLGGAHRLERVHTSTARDIAHNPDKLGVDDEQDHAGDYCKDPHTPACRRPQHYSSRAAGKHAQIHAHTMQVNS